MTSPPALIDPTATSTTALTTYGVVSFLNARPLREYLPVGETVAVRAEVPSRLIELLDAGQCDIALLPVVDYWRNQDRLEIVSDACIASDGETMTVRVFSRCPPDEVERLFVDGDSHTSIVLARLIWLELYGRRLEVIPWRPGEVGESPGSDPDVNSILLIGDKVVRNAPRGFGFEVDLGAAWKHLTNLPFVFAAWYGRKGKNHLHIARMLSAARDQGVREARRIARASAASHGWPVETAERYLCDIMKYKLTPAMRAGMDRFFFMAENHGLFE